MGIQVGLPEGKKLNVILSLLDCSGSMQEMCDKSQPQLGTRIEALNKGFDTCLECARNDGLLANTCYFGAVLITEPVKLHPLTPVRSFQKPELKATGGTPFGQAINTAMDHLTEFLHEVNNSGALANKANILLVSDGETKESKSTLDNAIARLRDMEEQNYVYLHLMGVTTSDVARLDSMGFLARAVDLSKVDWREAFKVVSQSASCLARGQKLLPSGRSNP